MTSFSKTCRGNMYAKITTYLLTESIACHSILPFCQHCQYQQLCMSSLCSSWEMIQWLQVHLFLWLGQLYQCLSDWLGTVYIVVQSGAVSGECVQWRETEELLRTWNIKLLTTGIGAINHFTLMQHVLHEIIISKRKLTNY